MPRSEASLVESVESLLRALTGMWSEIDGISHQQKALKPSQERLEDS